MTADSGAVSLRKPAARTHGGSYFLLRRYTTEIGGRLVVSSGAIFLPQAVDIFLRHYSTYFFLATRRLPHHFCHVFNPSTHELLQHFLACSFQPSLFFSFSSFAQLFSPVSYIGLLGFLLASLRSISSSGRFQSILQASRAYLSRRAFEDDDLRLTSPLCHSLPPFSLMASEHVSPGTANGWRCSSSFCQAQSGQTTGAHEEPALPVGYWSPPLHEHGGMNHALRVINRVDVLLTLTRAAGL
jgi:hypothetical protein